MFAARIASPKKYEIEDIDVPVISLSLIHI